MDRLAEAQQMAQKTSGQAADEAGNLDSPRIEQPTEAATDVTPEEATAVQEEAGVAYDSANRRAEMTDQLDGVADQATVEARVLADTSQARPATDATKTAAAGRSPKARKSTKTSTKQVQRSGLTR